MFGLNIFVAMALAASAPLDSRDTTPQATGLPGTTWAEDCSRPPSLNNVYTDYGLSDDGRLVETMRMPEKREPRPIRNIQILSKDWLLYTMDDSDGEAVNILTSIDKRGRRRTWWSVGKDGTPYVLNGRVPDGTGLPWFTKCE